MKAKARPKRAAELTPRHRSMRKKPLATIPKARPEVCYYQAKQNRIS